MDSKFKYCLCTEATDITFPYIRVMLNSFFKHNSEWFKGTIVLLTCDITPLSKANRKIIKGIYSNVEYVDIKSSKYELINCSAQEKIHLYKTEVFNIDTYDTILYISSFSLCISSSIFLFSGDADIVGCKNDALSDSIKVRSKRPTKHKNKTINTSVFLLSSDVSKYAFTDRILKSIINKRVSKKDRDIQKSVFTHINSLFLQNFPGLKINMFSSNKILKKSLYGDHKIKEFNSLIAGAGFIEINVGIFGKSNGRGLNRYKNIDGMWLSYNEAYPIELKREKIDDSAIHLHNNYVEARKNKVNKNKDKITQPDDVPHIKKDLHVKESKYSISIIVPAYDAADFIEPCVSSILNQETGCNIEILIGIDNCQATLSKLKSISDLPDTVKIYYSKKSAGPYVIRNSLLSKAKYDNILFFDADDIMMPNLVSTVLSYYSNSRPVRFKYLNFTDRWNYKTKNTPFKRVADGVFFINKEVMERIGGFQGWLCGADSEFIKRCDINGITSIKLKECLFYRRLHRKSLTQKPSTNHRSRIRNKAKLFIKNNRDWSIPVEIKTINLDKL